MAVTQRKDGLWAVSYRIDKKQFWEYFGRGIEGEKRAIERNLQLKSEGKIGQYNKDAAPITSPNFNTLANEYIKAKSIELPKISIDNLYYKLSGVILPELGEIQAIRLTHSKIRDYINKRLKTHVGKNTDKFISKSTIHRELSDIQAILNWSVAEKYIHHNPLAGFKKPARDDEIILPPTHEEIKLILNNSPTHLQRVLIISFYTGLRPGVAELFDLKWSDVNFESGLIHIISAKKGGARDRLIPLHPEFKSLLSQWKTDDSVDSVNNLSKENSHIIFWNGHMVKSVKKAFITAKIKAGIKRRLRLYDFRHAFATAMLKAGGDLKATSEMLGHTRSDTTSRIYQHTDIEMHRNNINLLPSLA